MKDILFVIFWITWDLANRKIIPALYEIKSKNKNLNFDVLWIGRRDFDKNQYYDYLEKNVLKSSESSDFNDFLKEINYFKVELNYEEYYQNLKNYLEANKQNYSKIIMYLAISPDLFVPVLLNIKKFEINKLVERVAFEKPFWFNLKSAIELNKFVLEVFNEEQIYRIDHYLGKEASQNILAFRFSNSIFEPIWNSNYIDNIQIIASEELWVLGRGEYYDNYGALRDMLQNHIFQVLTLVTMEPPYDLSAGSIKDEKVKVIKALKLGDDIINHVVYGQYNWYKTEKWVNPDSSTETFTAMRLYLDNWRFKWVPIYLKTWKALNQKKTHVVVEFKSLPFSLYKDPKPLQTNKIVFDLWSKEWIHMFLNVKAYWESKKIDTVVSSFNESKVSLDGYYRLILDLFNWESLLFTRWDMIEESWKLVDKLIDCKDMCPMVYNYEVWSRGPSFADALLEKDWRKWND